MASKRTIVTLSLLLAATLAACAGGSGSSGFDITAAFENQRIDEALTSRECVSVEETMICPTDQDTAAPGMPHGPAVDSGLGESPSPACVPAAGGTCTLAAAFALSGLPADADYRVVARGVEPPSGWVVVPVEDLRVLPGPVIEAAVMLPPGTEVAQLAFLTFLEGNGDVRSGPVETLIDTRADDIFVTQPFSITSPPQ